MGDTEEGSTAVASPGAHQVHGKRVVPEDTCPEEVELCTAMAADVAQSLTPASVKSVNCLGNSASSPVHANGRAHDEDPMTPGMRPDVKPASIAAAATPPTQLVADTRETSPGSDESLDCSSTRIAGRENPFATPSQPAAPSAIGIYRVRRSRSPTKHRRAKSLAGTPGGQGSTMVGEAHLPTTAQTPWHASQAALQAQEEQFARTAAWLSNSCHLANVPCAGPHHSLGGAQHQSSAGRQGSWPAPAAEQHLIGVANTGGTSFPEVAQQQEQQQQLVAAPSAPGQQLTYLGEVQEQLVHAYPNQPSMLHVSPRYSGSLVWPGQPGQDSGPAYVHPAQQQVTDMQRKLSWPDAPRLQARAPSMPCLDQRTPTLPYPPAIGGPPADAWAQPPLPPPPVQRGTVPNLSGPSLGNWGEAAEHLRPSLRSMSLALRNFSASLAHAPPPPQQVGHAAGGNGVGDKGMEPRPASRPGSIRQPGWATPPPQQQQHQQEKQMEELQQQQRRCHSVAREDVEDLQHELFDSHAAERDSLRTICALSARLNATLERETSLRQRLAQVEVALTLQQGEGVPGFAPPGEGFCGEGAESAARQKIAMLEASLQACYRQLELVRAKTGGASSPDTPLDSVASPGQPGSSQGSMGVAAAALPPKPDQAQQQQQAKASAESAAALQRERAATAAAHEQAAEAKDCVVKLERDLGHAGRRLEAAAAEGRAADAAATRLKQERAEAVGRAERAESGAAHARELLQVAAGGEKAAQRAAAAAEADAYALRQELGAARKALWEREGEVARLQASLVSARTELDDVRERYRRLERSSLRADAQAEPAGLRPNKNHSGGASRERKPTMPHTPAQPPPHASSQIGTTAAPHRPTYIGEVHTSPAGAGQDGSPLCSAFAQSAGLPRAHSAGGPPADAAHMHAGAAQGGGAMRVGSREAWSIGESTGRSSFDGSENAAWRPSQDGGGGAHEADAGVSRLYSSELALQDLMRHSAVLEERLLQLSLEEQALLSEAARTPSNGGRSAADRQRRAQVQNRLDGISGEAGHLRLQLKRLGVH